MLQDTVDRRNRLLPKTPYLFTFPTGMDKRIFSAPRCCSQVFPATLRSCQSKIHIPRIDISTTNTCTRKGRISTDGPRSTHTAFPPPLRNINRLSLRCGIQREERSSGLASRRSWLAAALLDRSCYPATDTEKSDIYVVRDECPRTPLAG